MAGIDGCTTLEACLADATCAQQWEAFKACEAARKDFSQCINLLTAAPNLLVRGAADCETPCAGVNAACQAQPTPGACARCCTTGHPQGFSDYTLVAYNCACKACDPGCTAATCQANQPPSDACVPCVRTSLSNDCDGDAAFRADCGGATGSDCASLVECLLNCR
jgi:hypothetical protein